MKEVARKHKIGKKERISLENEYVELVKKIDILNTKDEEGFLPFYYDEGVEGKILVYRKQWIEEALNRGFYHIIKNIE